MIEYTHKVNRVSIMAPNEYNNETYGICGNKDGNKYDDYRLRNGTVLPYPAQNYNRSWQEYASATNWIEGSILRRGCLPYDEDHGDDQIDEDIDIPDRDNNYILCRFSIPFAISCNPLHRSEIHFSIKFFRRILKLNSIKSHFRPRP